MSSKTKPIKEEKKTREVFTQCMYWIYQYLSLFELSLFYLKSLALASSIRLCVSTPCTSIIVLRLYFFNVINNGPCVNHLSFIHTHFLGVKRESFGFFKYLLQYLIFLIDSCKNYHFVIISTILYMFYTRTNIQNRV